MPRTAHGKRGGTIFQQVEVSEDSSDEAWESYPGDHSLKPDRLVGE